MNNKQTTILVIWIVLLINGLSFLALNYYINNIVLVGAKNWVQELVSKKVIEKKITETNNITNMESTITKTIDENLDSVVSIMINKDVQYYYADPFSNNAYIEKKKEKVWWWTGIIINANGYILTNKHVIVDPNSTYSVLLKNGDILLVDKIWKDPVLDLAVLHVINQDSSLIYNLKAAKIIDFKSDIKIWQFVIAIGNALAEYDDSVTLGILSAKGRELASSQNGVYMWLYQTDAAINPGNSWGPLMDIKWQVIGINTAITSQWQWVGFVLPINKQMVDTTLESIKKYWSIKRPHIWIKFIMLNKTMAKQNKLDKYKWALVTEVETNSPGYLAGLRKEDIIMKVWSVAIDNNTTLIQSLYTHSSEDMLTLLIWRDGENKELKLKLGLR